MAKRKFSKQKGNEKRRKSRNIGEEERMEIIKIWLSIKDHSPSEFYKLCLIVRAKIILVSWNSSQCIQRKTLRQLYSKW